MEVFVATHSIKEIEAFHLALHTKVLGHWGNSNETAGEDPMLKYWPPGSPPAVQVCYLVAAAVYANGLQLCSAIQDPKERQACNLARRTDYCDLIDGCAPEAA